MTHLIVDEINTEGVEQVEDGLVLGVVDGGRGNVGPDAVDDLKLACDQKDLRSSAMEVRFL